MDILLNMEQPRAASRRLKPSPTQSRPKFVSVFRIDGAPILPPLMTSEKRRQMKKLKEKAIELELKFEERRRQKNTPGDTAAVTSMEESTEPSFFSKNNKDLLLGTETCPTARSNCSSASQCSSDTAPDNERYLMLSNLVKCTQGRKKFTDSSSCTQTVTEADLCGGALLLEDHTKARMQKLQKSETLIYDNRTNAIIMPMSLKKSEQQDQEEGAYDLKQVLENPNIGYRPLSQQIPAICVNPPTPLVDSRNFCDALSVSVESLNSSMIHRAHSDEPSTDDSGNHCHPSPHALRAHKKVTNITAKIIQFETIPDCMGSIERLEPPCIKPPLRSATSPSLKPPLLTPTCKKLSHHSNDEDTELDNPLVRSNSFTLDGPSKVLLEHIRQQKSNTNQTSSKRVTQPSASATRDTVESKAKRVQKVEVKPRTQALRNAMANKPAAIFSPYGGNNSTSSNALLHRSKQRSPYELKSSSRTKLTRPAKTLPLATLAAGSVAVRQVRSKSSLSVLNNSALTTNSKPSSNLNNNNNSNSSATFTRATKNVHPELLSEIEAEHRQKFLQLVAQQHDEQQRLQQAFEAQQKVLLEQLSVDMEKAQFKGSPSNLGAAVILPLSEDSSPISSIALSEITAKMSPTLSLSSSANSYSVISSTVCDVTASADEPSCASTITTTTTTMSSNRHCTPRRRLFSREHSPVGAGNASVTSAASTSATRRHQQHLENQRRKEAATKICAYTRGFLTRRLFQTEQIQRIVQTIRDTLIFVLNLHMESAECPEEGNKVANIKLKARLLQQLSSASRTLHLVFFQTSIKERMDIIARDRKRIKTKLLAMNMKRSPRVAA